MFKTGCLLKVRYRLHKAIDFSWIAEQFAMQTLINDHFTNCANGVLLKNTLPAALLAQVLWVKTVLWEDKIRALDQTNP